MPEFEKFLRTEQLRPTASTLNNHEKPYNDKEKQ